MSMKLMSERHVLTAREQAYNQDLMQDITQQIEHVLIPGSEVEDWNSNLWEYVAKIYVASPPHDLTYINKNLKRFGAVIDVISDIDGSSNLWVHMTKHTKIMTTKIADYIVVISIIGILANTLVLLITLEYIDVSHLVLLSSQLTGLVKAQILKKIGKPELELELE
jgi:hypothetical protein